MNIEIETVFKDLKLTAHNSEQLDSYEILENHIKGLEVKVNTVDDGFNNIDNVIDFLSVSNLNPLMDLISGDLDINIDYEMSCIYCYIKEQRISASFEDIVKATNNRILIAIKSFTEKEDKPTH